MEFYELVNEIAAEFGSTRRWGEPVTYVSFAITQPVGLFITINKNTGKVKLMKYAEALRLDILVETELADPEFPKNIKNYITKYKIC